MAKPNLKLSEAAKLRVGDPVFFNPEGVGQKCQNPKMLIGMNPYTEYSLAEIRYFGFKRGATTPEELTASDLEKVTISDVYGKPLTNVCFSFEGLEGLRCYCYFTRK